MTIRHPVSLSKEEALTIIRRILYFQPEKDVFDILDQLYDDTRPEYDDD